MNTPAHPNRRAALRFALLALCLSAALVVILPVRAAPSAAPSQQMGSAFDVYMRDTVADNGTEPSAGSVYLSPDILVCNTRYCTSEQAPILNQDNYVYVTIRNSGPRVSPANWGTGTLYLYWTQFGTAANWTADWNLIGAQSNIITMGGDIRTIEFVWKPTVNVHYCLLTRWVAANDPMTTLEGINTYANARNNNNIAWHNVKPVIVPPSTPVSNPVVIRNFDQRPMVANLAIRPTGAIFPGTVDVKLDAELLEAWRAGGGRGVNIQQIAADTVRVGKDGGQLLNLNLKALAKPLATVIFTAPQGVQPGTFNIELQHFAVENGLTNLVGGAGFRVTTVDK